MQVHDETGAGIDIGADIEIATVFAVHEAEQIGQRVRILDVGRTKAQLRIQLGGVGSDEATHMAQAVGRIHISQHADVVRDRVRHLPALAGVDIDFDIAIAARVLGPLDGRYPHARVQAGRVVDIVGAGARPS